MSDVNVNTSWSSLPSSDTEYNTVLGVAGYNPDDERLFLSAQQVPGIARNVTTEYARGFRITSGYDGIVLHDAIPETDADLKTVKFTMSTAGSAYDLTDARCYVQFKNHYTVDIASWALQAEASDGTLTTVASGGTIVAGAAVQIDFKNDYNAVRFIMTVTYSGEVVYPKFYKIGVNDPIVKSGSNPGTNVGMVDYNRTAQGSGYYKNAPPTATMDVYMTLVTSNNTVYYFYKTRPYEQNHLCVAWRTYAGDTSYWYATPVHVENDYYYVSSNDPNYIHNTFLSTGGYTYETLADAQAAFTGAASGGLKTSDLNDYTGNMWQCRMIANVAAISPGPMATESEGGTEGDFDITSDQITAPGLPSEGYAGTASMYLIDKTNLARLKLSIFSANYWQQWITNFNDAVNSIVGILQIPVAGSAIPAGAVEHVRAANKELEWALGTVTGYVEGKPITNRYIQVDCGTVDLHLFWDSALDLNPYTKLNIYIPCVGMRTLDPDVVMSHTLGLYYNIDLMQGCALAVLTIDGDYLEQYPCSISTMFAIYGEQFTGLYQSVASTLATAAIGVTTAGSGGAMAGAIAGAATSAMAQKIHKGSAGTSASSMALLYQKQPYVEILRPIQQLPRDYTKFNAYPSYMTSQLINLSGYVEVQDIRLDDIDCTDAERTELMSMLQAGVIL